MMHYWKDRKRKKPKPSRTLTPDFFITRQIPYQRILMIRNFILGSSHSYWNYQKLLSKTAKNWSLGSVKLELSGLLFFFPISFSLQIGWESIGNNLAKCPFMASIQLGVHQSPFSFLSHFQFYFLSFTFIWTLEKFLWNVFLCLGWIKIWWIESVMVFPRAFCLLSKRSK